MRIKEEYIRNAADNIARCYEKEAAISERVCANFGELAMFAAQNAAKDIRVREFFSSGAPITAYFDGEEIYAPIYEPVSENKPLVDAKFIISDAMYVADFCQKTTECLKVTAKLRPSPLLFAGGERKNGGRVAFTESAVLKTAFSAFAKADSGLTAAYVSSFTEACEDTAAGLSKFCILPIENSKDGLLTSIYSLIERYELFISGVCTVESEGVSTKFALLCRSACGIIDNIKQQCITLRLFGEGDFMMSRLYIGADVIGVRAGSTVSVPLGYTDGYADICTFYGSGEELFAFLLYLGAKRIGHTLIGVYENT